MKTQVVTMTPPTSMQDYEARDYIAALLPSEVQLFLEQAQDAGDREFQLRVRDNSIEMTTIWMSDEALEQYKTLMADVSTTVKAQLVTDGWTFSFEPETADI